MPHDHPWPGDNPSEAERWVGPTRYFGNRLYYLFVLPPIVPVLSRGRFAFPDSKAHQLAEMVRTGQYDPEARSWSVHVVRWRAHPELYLVYARRL